MMMEWDPEVSWPELPDILKLLLEVPERTTIDFSTKQEKSQERPTGPPGGIPRSL